MIHLIESGYSNVYEYLDEMGDYSDFEDTVRKLRKISPIIKFHIQCYHKETRYQTNKDSSGNERLESYRVRVDTHSASKEYDYDHHVDISADTCEGIGSKGVTRIELTPSKYLH